MPNIVKGSKQLEMRVVPHRPGLRVAQAVLLLVTVATIAIASYFIGGSRNGMPESFPEDWQSLLLEHSRLERENLELKNRLAVLDNSAAGQPQGRGDTGLSISRLEIDPTGELSRYSYRLVLRQRDADGQTLLTGHVRMELAGRLGGQPASIPLGDLGQGAETRDILLRFRYFQNVEGEFTLPEGFIPEAIKVEAISTAPLAKTVAQEFEWIMTRG